MTADDFGSLSDNSPDGSAALDDTLPRSSYFQPMVIDPEHIGDRPTATVLEGADDTGRETAAAVKEAMHDVIDPELGVDVVDLGLLYGVRIDELGRAILTMTLTTPACPLTDLLEDETATVLAGIVDQFRIDWVWKPLWTLSNVTPDGLDQLRALGFPF
ncbi:MAG: metal-sulfur cluster assembly factor [Aeriscardovia sp.]|nr:metal-sulfur cluster assembly factor [Aeriscardovia sp.]